jgi:murein DD-endopeptidase MepM/ murein hydrolase activator NlpD
MANEFYTLIVVPHAKARFRKFQVPIKLTKWLLGVSGTGALTLAVVMVHFARLAGEVYTLRAQNHVLTTKNQEYEQSAVRLQAKISNLQNVVTKLGVMAGLEQVLPDPKVGGVGGLPSQETVAPSVDPAALRNMDVHVSKLTERSEQLEAFYKDQRALLSSTPSVWPVRGYLSASFGNRTDPFTGQPDFHPGIDISTPVGTKVQAPADGVVVACGDKGGYGNAIVIDHKYGIVTRYGHLAAFNVRPGQKVKRGDVIGFVGNTGKSTAPHLHYEVWVRDQAQNPIHFILDEYRSFG